MARGRPHRRVGARPDLTMLSSGVVSSVILLPSPLAGADRPQRAGRQQRFSAEYCGHLSDVPISWAGRRRPLEDSLPRGASGADYTPPVIHRLPLLANEGAAMGSEDARRSRRHTEQRFAALTGRRERRVDHHRRDRSRRRPARGGALRVGRAVDVGAVATYAAERNSSVDGLAPAVAGGASRRSRARMAARTATKRTAFQRNGARAAGGTPAS